MSGIRTFADLRERCYVDPETDCWHWRGAVTTGHPVMWIPAVQRVLSFGGAMSVLTFGEQRRDARWRATCGEKLCCNPAHRRRTTHAKLMAAAGLKRTPEQVAKCRRAATRHPEELVEAIRADVGTLVEVGARHGVSKSYVSRIRRQQVRRPASPFAGLLRGVA